MNWAQYLGHHWAHRAAPGEAQLTFNWIRAFGDYLINFHFGKGVHFHSPEASSAIIPYLLKRVWDTDNNRAKVLREIGQYGVVNGDMFVKVAWEEPYKDTVGRLHPPRIRIIPLNPAHCFPVFHPHDKSRLIEFKLKYKFWNTSADGTRQVMTYVEWVTDDEIREYVNDVLISQRPNPLGRIPVAYAPYRSIASSPWGLSPLQDIVPLNREYNEKATEISEIINYHAAPVTVIIGGKAQNLEKGPKKVWSLPNQNAKIENLVGATELQGPMGYMELLKLAMHELTSVPATALGTAQPITNTSPVALAMQFQPLMQDHNGVKIQVTPLLEEINSLVILYAAVYEPEWLVYNPENNPVPLGMDQYPYLNPADPMTYKSSVEWISPLPMDKLLKLNETQAMMAIGLESKKGALRELGEYFPDQKLREIFEELVEDAKSEGSLQLVRAQIAQYIMQSTGMTLDGQPLVVPGVTETDAEGNPTGMVPAVDPALAQELLMAAFAPYPPQREDFNQNSE